MRTELRLARQYLEEAVSMGAERLAPGELARARQSLSRAKAARSPTEKESLAQTAAFDAKWVRDLVAERSSPTEVRVTSPHGQPQGQMPGWLWALIGAGIFATGGFALTLARWFYHRRKLPPASAAPAPRRAA